MSFGVSGVGFVADVKPVARGTCPRELPQSPRWHQVRMITIRPSTTISKVSTYALRWSVCDRKHAFVHRSHVDKVIRFTQNLSPHTVRFDGRVLGNRLVHRHHGLERTKVFFTHHRHRFAHSHGLPHTASLGDAASSHEPRHEPHTTQLLVEASKFKKGGALAVYVLLRVRHVSG